MRKIIGNSALIASTVLAILASIAPVTANAQEGARSVGKGMKCSTRAVLQADATVKYQQVCYKSI